MTQAEIKKDVIILLSKLFLDKVSDICVIEDADLIDDLDMDSISFISLVVEIEDHFDFIIPDNLLLIEYFKCVDDIVSIIFQGLSNKTEKLQDTI